MKLLQINTYYNYGSTGKIAKDINDYLISKGVQTYICYSIDKGFDKSGPTEFLKYGTKIEKKISALLMRITGNRYGYAFFSTADLKRHIKKVNPDVIHIHCPNSYDVNIHKLLRFLKKNNYKTVITEHAEFFHTGNCPYALECDRWVDGCSKCPRVYYATKSLLMDRTKANWKKMKKNFEDFSSVILTPVSGWLGSRTVQSGITCNTRCKVVLNGINTNCFRFYDRDEVTEEVKTYFNRKTVLYVTSDFYSSIKGGSYALEIARRMPQYNFIIVCSGNIDCLGLDNVKHIRYIKNQSTLAQYYSMADVTLLTSKKETFGMTIAESLCCGTPVVGFYAGGPESIAIPDYSDFVEYSDVDALCEALNRKLETPVADKRIISSEAIKKYSSETMAKEYYNIYKELCGL